MRPMLQLTGSLALLASLFTPIGVPAFSPDTESHVGNRAGQSLDGYSPLSSRLTLAEARKFLGNNAVEATCRMGQEHAVCLNYLQFGPVVTFIVRHYFVEGRNRLAMIFAVPTGSDNLWTPIGQCHTVAKFTVSALVSLHGRPDETPWPNHYDFDPSTAPEFPPAWSGRPYQLKVARFTFPRGGEIKFEYVELPHLSCMVRAIYYWAPY